MTPAQAIADRLRWLKDQQPTLSVATELFQQLPEIIKALDASATVTPHDSDLDKPLASLARASERLNEIADLEIIPSSLIRGEAEIVRKRVVEIRALNNGATRPRGEGEINAAQPVLPESLSQEENAVTAAAIENVLSDANEGFDDGDPGSDVLNAFAMNGAAAILAKYDVRAKR